MKNLGFTIGIILKMRESVWGFPIDTLFGKIRQRGRERERQPQTYKTNIVMKSKQSLNTKKA